MDHSEKPFKKEHLTPKVEKKYINSQEILLDSYRLAKKVLLDKEFTPTWIVALWRGGCFIGSAVQEYLTVHGVSTDHIAIRTSHYDSGIDQKKHTIRIHGLHYLLNTCNHHDSLLIVDDVFDTGKSVKKLLEQIKSKMRRNTPHKIKTAVVYYKPKRNVTEIEPDYYIHKCDEWVVFPHELEGLTMEEIGQKEGEKGKEIVELLVPEELLVNKEEVEGEMVKSPLMASPSFRDDE